MAKFLGIVELGTIFINKQEQPIPTRPWYTDNFPSNCSKYGNGNTININNSFDNIKIGDTSLKKENRLRWIKIRDDNKLLYICDRCIFSNVSWDTLNNEGLIKGKNIEIDGNLYKIRTINGGTELRKDVKGFLPVTNEWDRFIVNEDHIEGLPVPGNSDKTGLNFQSDEVTNHSKFWNWWGIYDITSELHDRREFEIGYSSIYNTSSDHTSAGSTSCGWRPILEVIDTNKFLIKKDNKVYTIKTEYYNPLICQYEPIKDIDANNITAEDFEKYGFQDLENMYNEINKINYVMEPNKFNDGFHVTINENIKHIQDVQSEHKEV